MHHSEPCIRGHRATNCNHGRDRRLVPVRKPGRPLGEYHTRPSPLAISSEKHECRCGGLTAVSPDGKSLGRHAAERRRSTLIPEVDFQLPSPCCARSQTHESAVASPSPAELQSVVDHTSTPLPSPAPASRDRRFCNARSGTLANSRPATYHALVNTAACVSPHSFTFDQGCITRMYDMALEAPFPWTPPGPVPQTPRYALPNMTTMPATQPIGVNLPLCTHCAGQTPGIVQPQVLVLNHLGQAQAWSPGTTHSHQAAGNAPPQTVVVYVSVQPQATPTEHEPQDWAAARSVHNHTNETAIPRCFQPNLSDDLQTLSGANLSWSGQLQTGTSQTVIGTSANTITGEGVHGCTAWLQALPLSLTQMPFSCVDELGASLLSPAPEPAAWNNNLSGLCQHSGDALMPPLSVCRCGRQHSGGCGLG